MKVLIIEDEQPAAEKLKRLLLKYNPNVEVLANISSIKDGVAWLLEHQAEVEVIFADIQLSDGLSFDIFRQVKVVKPVIFTTAFDEYAIEAFKVNSIDYLLKPITYTALADSLAKLESLRENLGGDAQPSGNLQDMLSGMKKAHKERFMVKLGEHIRSVKTEEIALLYAEGRTVFLLTRKGRKFIIDFKMEELEQLLDPALFYRVNRTYIVNINAINDVVVFSTNRLQVSLQDKVASDREIIVSRDKVASFKSWFDGAG